MAERQHDEQATGHAGRCRRRRDVLGEPRRRARHRTGGARQRRGSPGSIGTVGCRPPSARAARALGDRRGAAAGTLSSDRVQHSSGAGETPGANHVPRSATPAEVSTAPCGRAFLMFQAGVTFSSLSSVPSEVVTYSAPSGPLRTARNRPNLSSNSGGSVTSRTLPAASKWYSRSFWPFRATTTSAPSFGPHWAPVRNASPLIASVIRPEVHSGLTASGNRLRSGIGTLSS